MSETRKARDAAARASHAARETMEQGEETAQQAAEEFRDVGESVADTVVRTADAAVEMGQRVAAQSREVMLLGVRAAAGMNGRIADAGYGRGHRVLGAAARALQVWHQASGDTAENLQALFNSSMAMGRGVQQMQHAYLDLLDRAAERAAHKPQDLLRCKSLEQFAEVQRDLYLDAVNYAVESSSALLQLAARATDEAMRPLRGRSGNGAARG